MQLCSLRNVSPFKIVHVFLFSIYRKNCISTFVVTIIKAIKSRILLEGVFSIYNYFPTKQKAYARPHNQTLERVGA